MTKAGFLKRIEELEKRYKRDPLVVMAKTDDGGEERVLLRDLAARGEAWRFIRVVGGSDIDELNILFREWDKAAEEIRENE